MSYKFGIGEHTQRNGEKFVCTAICPRSGNLIGYEIHGFSGAYEASARGPSGRYNASGVEDEADLIPPKIVRWVLAHPEHGCGGFYQFAQEADAEVGRYRGWQVFRIEFDWEEA